MSKQELRAATSLAAVFSLRMLGLFMIYPVFALFARELTGATAETIGLALGIYGLTQGLLQMPFGLLSDHLGRKVMVVAGLVLFGVGSAWAARAHSIDAMIGARALQGAGAVGAVILALVADLTAEENRTKAMALVGMTIGLSFFVALVLGPVLAGWIGVAGIFWLMSALAVIAILVTVFVVPTPQRRRVHREAEPVTAMLGATLRNSQLLRLDFGIFALHAMLTASFLIVPVLFAHTLGLGSRSDWWVYLPILLISVAIMVPAIIIGERRRRMKGVVMTAVAALLVSQIMLAAAANERVMLLVALTVFFAGFNVMEASLPSLVTKIAPTGATGTATGVYSSAQFLGIFAGGAAGGWMQQHVGTGAVFEFTGVLAALWLVLVATMRQPTYLSSRVLPLGKARRDARELAAALREVPGVTEAVVVVEDGVAYLKVDPKVYDAQCAAQVAGAPQGAQGAQPA
jgi:predicted MFS family arabinose efflux permease